MKKSSTRTVLLLALICASLFSYTYLSLVSPIEREVGLTSSVPMEKAQALGEMEEEELEDTDIILPDITLLKRIVSLGRHLLPGS